MRVTIELDDLPTGGLSRTSGAFEPDLDGGTAPAWLVTAANGEGSAAAGDDLPPEMIDAGGPPAWLVGGLRDDRAR